MVRSAARRLGLLLAFGAVQAPSIHALQVPDSAVARRIAAFESDLRPYLPDSSAASFTLAQRMAFHHIPGVSIAVVRSDKISWTRTYGVRQAREMVTLVPPGPYGLGTWVGDARDLPPFTELMMSEGGGWNQKGDYAAVPSAGFAVVVCANGAGETHLDVEILFAVARAEHG